jgi:hypothetical protein
VDALTVEYGEFETVTRGLRVRRRRRRGSNISYYRYLMQDVVLSAADDGLESRTIE